MTAELTERIGWALVCSLWQSALIAAALFAALAVLRRPQTRYLASATALGAMLMLPMWSAFERAPDPPRAFGAAVAPTPDLAHDRSTHGRSGVMRSALLVHTATLRDRMAPSLAWLTTLWVCGVTMSSARMVGGWLSVRDCVRGGTRPVSDALRRRLTELRAQLAVTQRVCLFESCRVRAPMVVGVLRPAILVPASALSGLTPAALDAILIHELAHVRRHDYLANLLQSLVEVMQFYHPAVWWASRQMRRERELCCDDLAVAACGDPVLYAHALVTLEELRGPTPTVTVAATGGDLMYRIRRLVLDTEHRPSAGPAQLIAGIIAVAAISAIAHGATFDPAPPAPELASRPLSTLRDAAPPAPHPPAPAPATAPDYAPRATLGSMAPTAPTPPAPRPVGGGGRSSGSVHIDHHADSFTVVGDQAQIRVSLDDSGDERVVVTIDGHVELDLQTATIRRIDGGSRLVAEVVGPGGTERMEVDIDGPRAWTVDGQSLAIDATAQRWFDAAMRLVCGRLQISGVRGERSTLRGQISTIRGERSTLRGQISTLRGERSALRGQISAIMGERSAARGRISAVRGEQSALRGRRSALHARRDSASSDPRTTAELAEVERELTRRDWEAEAAAVERQISELDVERRIAAVEAEIEKLDIEPRVTEIERQIDALDVEGQVADIQREIDALDVDGEIESIESSRIEPAKRDLRRVRQSLR